jgi:serine/threonine protein phosphatase 1
MNDILLKIMKTFVVGDIHGAYKALRQCLERSGFDYAQDRLIALGDVCDGYPEVHLCIDELLKIKHQDYILGNHDLWVLDWALEGNKPEVWTSQGGKGTLASYKDQPMPEAHINFLKKAHRWVIVENKVFVHGGFNPMFELSQQNGDKFVWDRDLLLNARDMSLQDNNHKFSIYEEIFVGHTPVQNFKSNLPQHFCNVWALDTGAGWMGPLTIMDIHTKEYWQSDPTSTLYEGFRSR